MSEKTVKYDKLVDTEIATGVTTLHASDFVNPREKTASINFVTLKAGSDQFSQTTVQIDESTIYNLSYKLKSAVNQIQEAAKSYLN